MYSRALTIPQTPKIKTDTEVVYNKSQLVKFSVVTPMCTCSHSVSTRSCHSRLSVVNQMFT